MTSRRPDASQQDGCDHPTYATEVGCRLGTVISLYPTKKAAADMAGISPDQLTRYVKGQNAAPFEVLARLAGAKGVSLDWLATGEGTMLVVAGPQKSGTVGAHKERDQDLYGRVLEAISAVYKEMNWGISLRQLGAEAAQIADDISAEGLAPDEKPPAVKAAAAMLRRKLRDAAADPAAEASTKGRA